MRNALYTVATFLLSLIMAARLLVSSRGRARIWERFGFWRGFRGAKLPKEVIWFHGASLGEMEGLVPIVERFSRSSENILCTTTSITGAERAEKLTVYVKLLPFDSFPYIANALCGIRIKALIIAEAEIWPGLFAYLHARKIPIIIVNGRISQRSQERIKRFSWILGNWTDSITWCCVVDESSKERYRSLGIGEEKLSVAGNAKYDREPKVQNPQGLKEEYFNNDAPTIVIGSIRPGEEAIVFPALRRVLQNSDACNIIVAPRHTEKFKYFEDALKQLSLPYRLWSEQRLPIPKGTILLLDTIGLLENFYSFADGALIGGTLVDYGGHNPLEPAPYHVSVASGPYTSSTGHLVDELSEIGAARRVADTESVFKFFDEVIKNDPSSVILAEKLHKYWEQNRGAAARIEVDIREVCKSC